MQSKRINYTPIDSMVNIPEWFRGEKWILCFWKVDLVQYLLFWNLLAFLGHAAIGIPLTIYFGTRTGGLDTPSFTLYMPAIEFIDEGGDTRPVFTPSYTEFGFKPGLPWMTFIFFALSALAHLVILLFNFYDSGTVWTGWYFRWIDQCKNPLRWVEYAVSASIMLLTIAYTSGINGIYVLITLFMLCFTTMVFGWVTEALSRPVRPQPDDLSTPPSRWATRSTFARLTPHFLGYFPYATIWVILLHSFYYNTRDVHDEIPGFVFAIVWGQLGLFSCFAVVQLVQQSSDWGCRYYYYGEISYCILSFTAKMVLGGLLIGNIFMFDRVDDAFSPTSV